MLHNENSVVMFKFSSEPVSECGVVCSELSTFSSLYNLPLVYHEPY